MSPIKTLTDTELGVMFSELVKTIEPLTHNERLRLVSAIIVFYDLPIHPAVRGPNG